MQTTSSDRNVGSPLVLRRTTLRAAGAGFGLWFLTSAGGRSVAVEAPAISGLAPRTAMDPLSIPKYQTALLIPPVMPRAGSIRMRSGPNADYYEISMRQFSQQILPGSLPSTVVWGYGAVTASSSMGLLLHNAPSLTIEAHAGTPVRVKWINDLVDRRGHYLPHLLAVDPTLHWANPVGGKAGRDTRPDYTGRPTPGAYTGPVPTVTHVHGAVGVGDESDGYSEAWYLPAAKNIPSGYATVGTWYDFFAGKARHGFGERWGPGFATFQYPNLDRASTKWYHDHTLGMTRLNVYAGPAGFYIIRGGPHDVVLDKRHNTQAVLPGPAPKENDKFPSTKTYREIPIVIQDRSFNADGSLFYPDTRAYFDQVVAPLIPQGEFSPIWNPEFFGNTLMVNGNTWPFQKVEQRRYRLRFLNGCQSRFLNLDFNDIPGVQVWAIGNEGGFLTAPVNLTATNGNRLLLALAERADLIVDFTKVPVGKHVLRNVAPDEPFGGGTPDEDFDAADPATTGQVLQFRVVQRTEPDPTTPPKFLRLPALAALPKATVTRQLALIEQASVGVDAAGAEVEGPVEALLGIVTDGVWASRMWADDITENPDFGAVEVWEIYNTTADAHPMHIHEVAFEVVNREGLVLNPEGEVASPLKLDRIVTQPETWETGVKDTVVSYPGQVTRVRMKFGTPGQYAWHCHIVEHEDNEMMRPYRIGPKQPGQPQ
jgi:FtsP/CotA-like multicopper oxidase with cupredoxin domain